MLQRRWKTGIVLIKAVKIKKGTEKRKDFEEQISMAGRFQALSTQDTHLQGEGWGIGSLCETSHMTRVQTKVWR